MLDGSVELVPITDEYAADIVSWHYDEPYACYDMTSAEVSYLTDPSNGFFAVLDGSNLVGYRSFGPDGRVPGGSYDDSALDTGGGLRPSLTGRGLGRVAIAAGLAYGRQYFGPAAFRVTVATFNVRALTVVTSLGFRPVSEFEATTGGKQYRVLVRTAVHPSNISPRESD